MTDRTLLAHLVACAPCRGAGPLQLVDDLVPPPRLRVELLAAAQQHRQRRHRRPRPARRVLVRHHHR